VVGLGRRYRTRSSGRVVDAGLCHISYVHENLCISFVENSRLVCTIGAKLATEGIHQEKMNLSRVEPIESSRDDEGETDDDGGCKQENSNIGEPPRK